jgi:hypothetical protein
MIGRIALRMAAVEAIKSADTMVGANVLDSEIGALDADGDGNLSTDQEKPFISVYVEAAKLEGDKPGGGADLRALHRSGPTDLIIEIGITAAMTTTNETTGASEVVGLQIPATDQAFEFFLDCTGRQVVNALTDPRNAWAELWRGLSASVVKIERKRTSNATNGARIAAHQLVITVDLLPDPVYGEPIRPTSIWAKFFAMLAADTSEVGAKKRAALLALVGDPEATLESEAQRQRFGMTLDEVRAMFDIAVEAGEATEPPIASVGVERVP